MIPAGRECQAGEKIGADSDHVVGLRGERTVIIAFQRTILCSSARTNTEEDEFNGKSTWSPTASTESLVHVSPHLMNTVACFVRAIYQPVG